MENPRRVLCPENEALVSYLLEKRNELAGNPKGISENVDKTLSKAYSNICASNLPITSLKELSQVKGVGQWILKLMHGYFDATTKSSELEDLRRKDKNAKGTKRYLPQRKSVAYALLITLYRGTTNGDDFMRKQELIDAAEASGLSRVPIVPEKGKGRPSDFGSSARDWYSGWSCMKTLITKGLVVKSSCPAKYMLTEEGKEAARECLMRSHLPDPGEHLTDKEVSPDMVMQDMQNLESVHSDIASDVRSSSTHSSQLKKPMNIPAESMERFTRMGYSEDKILQAFAEVSDALGKKDISLLWPAVLCCLREAEVYGLSPEHDTQRMNAVQASFTCRSSDQAELVDSLSSHVHKTGEHLDYIDIHSALAEPVSFTMRACSSSNYPLEKSSASNFGPSFNLLSRPPLHLGERFEDVYEIVLILDDREQFNGRRGKGMKLIENICKEHKIKIEAMEFLNIDFSRSDFLSFDEDAALRQLLDEFRQLPVGDGIWIARHKYVYTEYVLDFIVERKNINDFRSSIRDNRYKDQKVKLVRCGLKKLIYLVEGDPNNSEAAASIKTACFTTEILEGFDVQRTNSLPDTLKKYANLTHSISQYYRLQLPEDQSKRAGVCPPYDEFVRRCKDFEKVTVSDLFAIQLLQVPQVTEEIALAVVDSYPTVASLARAYSLLDGDTVAQEEMLRKQSNNFIGAAASKSIFQLVWADDGN